MSARVRRPETVVIPLTQGDTITIRKHLTAGEKRAMFGRMYFDHTAEINPIKVGWSKCIAYLLDWTFTDADDRPIKIADEAPETVGAALDNLDAPAFTEVLRAIENHDKAIDEALEQEKNALAGEIKSSPISPSAA